MTQQQLYQHIKPKADDIVLGEILAKSGFDIVHCVPNRHFIMDKKGHFPDRVYIHTLPSKKYEGYAQIHVMNLTQSPYYQAVFDKFNELIYCYSGLEKGQIMEYNEFLKRDYPVSQKKIVTIPVPDFPVMVDIESPRGKQEIVNPPEPAPTPSKKAIAPKVDVGVLDFD